MQIFNSLKKLFFRLLSHTEMTSNQTWRLKQLKYLFKLGLCESENVGVDLASNYIILLFTCL